MVLADSINKGSVYNTIINKIVSTWISIIAVFKFRFQVAFEMYFEFFSIKEINYLDILPIKCFKVELFVYAVFS